MKEVEVKFGVPTTVAITINNFSSLNRTFEDITDVLFFLKNKATDLDTASVVSKKYKGTTGQIVLNTTSKKVVVNLVKSDFGAGKMESGGNYLIAVGIEFNNDGVYLEDRDDKFERRLKVKPDKIRA